VVCCRRRREDWACWGSCRGVRSGCPRPRRCTAALDHPDAFRPHVRLLGPSGAAVAAPIGAAAAAVAPGPGGAARPLLPAARFAQQVGGRGQGYCGGRPRLRAGDPAHLQDTTPPAYALLDMGCCRTVHCCRTVNI
jgi:hypothetical protein